MKKRTLLVSRGLWVALILMIALPIVAAESMLFEDGFDRLGPSWGKMGSSGLIQADGQLELRAENPSNPETGALAVVCRDNFPVPQDAALEISVEIDPYADSTFENIIDNDAGLSIGMPSGSQNPNRFLDQGPTVFFEVKELGRRGRYSIVIDGKDVSFWGRPREAEYGLPNIFYPYGGPYKVKIVAIPRGETTGLRFFFDHMDRPLKMYNYDTNEWVFEWTLNRKLTENNFIGLYVRQGGRGNTQGTALFDNLTVRTIPIEQAEHIMGFEEFVMSNLNYDAPQLAEVKAARDAGDMDRAADLFIQYMRTRKQPAGPEYNKSWARAWDHGKEANWREVADNALVGSYSTTSWFTDFSTELSDDDLTPKWDRDPGFLTRMFHWLSLAHAYKTTGEAKYAARIGEEVIDYVKGEPYVWYGNPNLGGQLDWLDGSVLAEHMLWTGNVGRRLELTWWQTFEVIRSEPAFTDEAMFAFLDSVIRQCRLLTNPSICKIWDDSGLHGALALVKSSMLFGSCDEAPLWSQVGWDRLNRIVDLQFHPDGSHVSLSTGYNWATISGFQEFAEYLHQQGKEVPSAMQERMEKMYYHPMMIGRPDFGSIDLNDGGWSSITNLMDKAIELFPERKDYLWFYTQGKEGEPPADTSIYFPNAGQYVMCTGWGPQEQYLFYDAGPWGASHGKQDALNIYAAFGSELLIRNAGRGAYSGVGNTIHAGKSLSYNTVSPDWGEQNRIPVWEQEKQIGFNPPHRRWFSDEHFDYGEGFFEYGWPDSPVGNIPGKHTRQVIFVKGPEPAKTGYYVVFDTVESNIGRELTWRHPWQLGPGNIEVLPEDNSTLATGGVGKVRIIPVAPADNMTVDIIKGQEKPKLLGWRVAGEVANPFPVPTYAWKVNGSSTVAWVIAMGPSAGELPVASASATSSSNGVIQLTVTRADGGKDYILRRPQGDRSPTEISGETFTSDVAVHSIWPDGTVARLAVPENKADHGR